MRFTVVTAALLSAASAADALVARQNICGASSITDYTIQQADTLRKIAKQFNSGICDIVSLNKIANPNVIPSGGSLKIPVNCTSPDNTSCVPPEYNATAICSTGPPSTYDVRSGDTLTSIAKDFNITLPALEKANSQITNFDAIDVGQIINIPVCAGSGCFVGTYVIKSGDIFFDLGQKYGSSAGQIEGLNVGVDPTKLAVGQQIILPQNCYGPSSAEEDCDEPKN